MISEQNEENQDIPETEATRICQVDSNRQLKSIFLYKNSILAGDHLIPEIRGSDPVIDNFFYCQLYWKVKNIDKSGT